VASNLAAAGQRCRSGFDLPSRHAVAARDAHPKLDCGLELGGAADADAHYQLLQLDRAECEQTMQPAGRDPQPLSSLQAGHASDNSQEFGIGQGGHTLVCQAMARLISGKELADGERVGLGHGEKCGLERRGVVRGVVGSGSIAGVHD
jgi:hypothetical protein